MTARRWVALAAVTVALLLLVGRAVATLYVEYRWYDALGAAALWRSRTETQLALGALSALAGGAFLFLNLWAVRRSVVSLVLPRRVANLEIGEEVPPRYLTIGAAVIALALGVVLTLPNQSWTTFSLWRHGVEFGESDPFFSADLSYFVYWLPLETDVYIWAVVALILASAVVVFLYALTPSLRWERGTLRASQYVRRHLTVLGVLLLMLLAWSYRLDAYATLGHGSGPAGAFTSLDRGVVVPANLALAALTVGIGLVVLWSSWTGQMRMAFGALTTVLVLSLALRQALPVLARRFTSGAGDSALREAAYVATGLSFTRRAYDTDRVRAARADSQPVGYHDLATLGRLVPVWDPAVLTREVQRSHPGTTAEPAVGWQIAYDGRALATVVLRPPRAQGGQQLAPWAVVRVLGGETDERGSPVRANLLGQPTDDYLALPPVYFADSIGGWVVVSDSTERFAAEELESWRSRLAHAWSLQDWRFLFNELAQPTPRILLHRGVRERVEAVAPFFQQDRTVQPLVYADSLYWVLHLYSVSDAYPLSQHVKVAGDEWSYFRHAAVAVVNAHTGRVSLVADSVADPIARTWRRAFPSLFTDWSALPRGITALVPPALDGAYAQAVALARCNGRPTCSELVTAPSALHLAGPPGADSATTLAAEPLLLLPDPRALLAWSIPLADRGDRVRGVVLAQGGAEGATYWVRVDSTRGAPSWPALVARLRNAADSASADVPPGQTVRNGRLRAAPIGGTAVYVMPHYTTRPDGGAALLRVAVSVGDSMPRAGRDIASAIGVRPPPPPGALGAASSAPVRPADFRVRVAALYDAMQAALRRGDFDAFGSAYAELGALLGRPRAARPPVPAPAPARP